MPGTDVPRGERIIIRNATILTMDESIGDFANGDILIDGGVIVEIGPSIQSDAHVVEANGSIVLPGFCDPHIHSWEGALGRLIPNNASTPEADGLPEVVRQGSDSTRAYFTVLHHRFAPLYEPEDIYIGTLATLLTAIDGGITSVGDNMHNARSFDHSVAAVEALIDSGVRGFHAYGRPRVGSYDLRFLANAERLRDQYFSSDDQLTAMRIYALGRDDPDEVRDLLRVRRDLDLWVTFDSGLETLPLEELYGSGELDDRVTLNHASFLDLDQRSLLRDAGSRVNVCPRIETQFRRGDIPYREWVDIGVQPGLSNDNPATFGIDMFAEMQTLYNHVRAQGYRAGVEPRITLRETLAAATRRGADNCGFGEISGVLAPGRAADLIMIDTTNVRLTPTNNAYASVVQAAHPGLVSAVMIGGRFRKWEGELVDVNLGEIRNRIFASQERLFAKADWPLSRIDFSD
ncbi:amidohydrolase family protein [Microbacterium sp. P02]|uniref:amidohydrolase family protein n=1 Tax=unclassified Microbacterium TaxID=2609290 RepID=UPI00366E8C72